MHDSEILLLREVMIFLASAIFIVLVLHRLKWNPVVGYLAAGALIGPYGLKLIYDSDNIHHLANLGVIFLMFTIGLELSFKRLRSMRVDVFGLGLSQVLVSGLVIGLAVYIFTGQASLAVVLGCALALSSTAVVLQMLTESGDISGRMGRKAFAVLLFQDIAVVPILLLVSLMANNQPTEGGVALLAVLKAVGAIVVIIIAGRWLLRPLFRLVASTRSPELFAAATLLTVLGISVLIGAVGLSMALGAFLAGLLLAETEYRQQVEADIQPFKGLLLGLFFMTVGMGLDWHVLLDQWATALGILLCLLVGKALVIVALGTAFKLPPGMSARLGLSLAQSGEFAFVIFGLSMSLGILPGNINQLFVVITGLSIALTPGLISLGRHAERYLDGKMIGDTPGTIKDTAADLEGHVVIAGFGRVGQAIARLLTARKIPYIALDLQAQRVETAHKKGLPVFYGNASRIEILKAAGLERATAAVITLDNAQAAGRTVKALRDFCPNLDILVRAKDIEHSKELEAMGATNSICETLEASLQLGGQVLRTVGTPPEIANQIIDDFRQDDYFALQKNIVAGTAEEPATSRHKGLDNPTV